MFQRRSLITVMLMTAVISSAIAADENLTIDDGDQNIAALLLPTSRKMRERLKLDGLRGSKHPDGVFGSTFFELAEPPVGRGDMRNSVQEALHSFTCSYAIFGVAELQNSKSFIKKDDVGIFTKLRFKLVDSWSVQPGSKVKSFDLLVVGGEVKYKGEIIRLSNPQAAYIRRHHYLMILHSAVDKNIFAGTTYLLEISDGAIYPASGWSPFKPGTTLTRAKAMVQESIEEKGCE